MRIVENLVVLLLLCQSFLVDSKSPVPRVSSDEFDPIQEASPEEIRNLAVDDDRNVTTPAPTLSPSASSSPSASLSPTLSPTASPSSSSAPSDAPPPTIPEGSVVRDLFDFTITILIDEENLEGASETVEDLLEAFFAARMGETFSTFEALNLVPIIEAQTRQAVETSFSFGGEAYFKDQDDTPTQEEVYAAQQAILDDLAGLKLALEDVGDVTDVTTDDDESETDDEESGDDPDELGGGRGIAAGTLVWVIFLIGAVIIGGAVYFVKYRKNNSGEAEFPKERTNDDLLVDTAAVKPV